MKSFIFEIRLVILILAYSLCTFRRKISLVLSERYLQISGFGKKINCISFFEVIISILAVLTLK